MFQLSLFTEFGRLCNPFDYVLGFTFLLMAFHLLFLLFNLRERQRVKLFCLGSASLVLLLHIACVPPRQDSSPDNSGFRKEVDA